MSIEKRKLSEVTLAETAADNANVLIEEGGAIKRVPKNAVGGSGKCVLREITPEENPNCNGQFLEIKGWYEGDNQKTYYLCINGGEISVFDAANFDVDYPDCCYD